MSLPQSLQALVGRWIGTSRLLLPGEPVRETSSEATVSLVAQGKFCTLAYSWSFDGTAQDGMLLIGQEQHSARVIFIDSWHMGDAMMICQGQVDGQGTLDVRGSYAVEGSADWGWRIVVAPDGHSVRILMYNVTPDGEEVLGVEATYTRAEAAM